VQTLDRRTFFNAYTSFVSLKSLEAVNLLYTGQVQALAATKEGVNV